MAKPPAPAGQKNGSPQDVGVKENALAFHAYPKQMFRVKQTRVVYLTIQSNKMPHAPQETIAQPPTSFFSAVTAKDEAIYPFILDHRQANAICKKQTDAVELPLLSILMPLEKFAQP